ncbi:MAG: hypothetical protein IKM99_01275 [Bacteroidales bacterium]|nr:hypothetical protein [Bacteroidales bacterium]
MKNKLAFILCILTLGVFVMIYVQDRTRLFKLKGLNGVYHDPKDARLTFNSFLNGSFQENLEENLRYNFGFREVLIPIYNQYIWDFYHQSSNYKVEVGKDDWLFGWDDVASYYQGAKYRYGDDKVATKAYLDREASRMYKVQHILDEYGIFIFVSLLPSKAFVFPEYLPKTQDTARESFHAIEYYPHLFDSLGVNYINVQKIFEDQKGKVYYPLFPKTGMHWSHIAAQHAFDTILRYVEYAGHRKLLHYTFGEPYASESKYPDADLEAILNLMRPIKPNNNYYTEVKVVPDSTASYPTFLVIGDSFFWNISGSVPLGNIFRRYQFWYYNSTVYFNDQYQNTNEVDYLSEILNARIIDLSYSPRQLYIFSNDFLPKALLYLTHEDDEIDSTLYALATTLEIASDEERMKAAQDSLFSSPETFFPDLAEDGIPTTRNSRIHTILGN